MAGFSVDTKLFRELGELLVGRESTALVELIKNSYDADATRVLIHGEHLDDEKTGVIVVADDGVGMTREQFVEGFLRIAGRTKTIADVKSALYGRRYTGEKGVGRLAAHKLAHLLEVESLRYVQSERDPVKGLPAKGGVLGRIDWDRVEQCTTLDEVAKTTAVRVEAKSNSGSAGTRITMRHLRRAWTKRQLNDFFSEVATLVPVPLLVTELPKTAYPTSLLFDAPRVRGTSSRDPGFRVEYSGALKEREPEVASSLEQGGWGIEIDCDATARRVKVAVEPNINFKTEFSIAEGFRVSQRIPNDQKAVSFQARIFDAEQGQLPSAYQGIKVYMEGFRVLPYGDRGDDWLRLDFDYRARGRQKLGRIARFSAWNAPEQVDNREGLVVKGANSYFGAVFFTRDGAPDLKMLVNREGFLPGPEWDFVVDVVRWAIGVQVRCRYAATHEVKKARRNDAVRHKEAARRADVSEGPTTHILKSNVDEIVSATRAARAALMSNDLKLARETISRIEDVAADSREILGEGQNEITLYRILASIGLEHSAFVHEITGLAGSAETLAANLERLARSRTMSAKDKDHLRALAHDAGELRERLRRNGIYLADMTGVEGRRRRSRQSFAERFDRTVKFYERAAAIRNIRIDNGLPKSLVSPPMFPAELVALFGNLLSNAIKFGNTGGRILASGHDDDDWVVVRVENTGMRVDLKSSEKWFQPFRSTTASVDASLGQGMGLGLTISRSLMDEYGGSIAFVSPSKDFATAVELRWPKR